MPTRLFLASLIAAVVSAGVLFGLGQHPGLAQSCDPAYPDVCVPPGPPDLNCEDLDLQNFKVLEPDPHGLDDDGDGLGCDADGPGPFVPGLFPVIGMVIYGDAPHGAALGQAITATVSTGAGTFECGGGEVIEDGGLKYVVRVRMAYSESLHCGGPGRTIELRFNATASWGGSAALPTIEWQQGPKEVDLVLVDVPPPLYRAIFPGVASDGITGE